MFGSKDALLRANSGYLLRKLGARGFTSPVRFLSLVWLLLASCVLAHAQSSGDEKSFEPGSVPPDIFITVQKHASGSEVVTVTPKLDAYPPELLRDQSIKVGEFAGSQIRALQVSRSELSSAAGSVTRATFGCDFLIDRATGALNIESLVKAFLAAPQELEIRSFVIQFDGEYAQFNTLKTFQSDFVAVSGSQLHDPPGIEYRVVVFTQDPDRIRIPLTGEEAVNTNNKKDKRTSGTNPVVFILLGGALVAGGALVYLALVRPGSPK
ncbi:hypothetical protein QPK87_18335 [Kamptonema cortianum]|nr:hypothetical protein [Geitlerinema splendidum]MDK3158516.1 hypothetical protein [Kamptonema cortianum]